MYNYKSFKYDLFKKALWIHFKESCNKVLLRFYKIEILIKFSKSTVNKSK